MRQSSDQATKIGILVPVRLSSTRLPRKILLDLAGKPAIEHLIERIRLSEYPDIVVLCTTVNPADDELVEFAGKRGIPCFRGSEEDMLDRYLGAALAYQIDLIVNVDSDDLLVDPEQIDAVAKMLVETNADFVSCEGLPFGAAPVGVRVEALRSVCGWKTETQTDTGWGKYFTDSGLFKLGILRIEDEELRHPEIRLTLDYPEDYAVFKAIFDELYREGHPVRLREALRLLSARPDIVQINSGLQEEYWQRFKALQPTIAPVTGSLENK